MAATLRGWSTHWRTAHWRAVATVVAALVVGSVLPTVTSDGRVVPGPLVSVLVRERPDATAGVVGGAARSGEHVLSPTWAAKLQ